MKDELDYYLALNRAPGVGAVNFSRLREQSGDVSRLFTDPALQSSLDLQDSLRNYLREPDWQGVESDREWAEAGEGRRILSLADPHYPRQLLDLHGRPPILFVIGNVEALAMPQLAVVGSRNPTADGEENARKFAEYLGANGLAITSGLAEGVDAASHQGCLAAGGITIAVTGTGLDRVYPAKHRELAHQIADNGGALVSEFTPGTPVSRENFPRRNRVISGLSLGVLVVEAARQSGSLITARYALEQGREVFAIPGSIHNPLARGCHQLIRQGAKLVETAADIYEELYGLLVAMEQEAEQAGNEPLPAPVDQLDEDYQNLLACMGYDPQPVDVIIARSGLTAEAVSSMLLVLELQDFVQASPGGRYSRK